MIQTLLYFLVAYSIISVFFFLFPNLIHTHKKIQNKIISQALKQNKILKIAHRGCPRFVTENTMEGFTKVSDVTDCIEMDVCETADKILVVHHDHHLKRTCGIDRDVEQFNYEQLPCFSDNIVLDFGVERKIISKGQKIPKLQDVFKEFPEMMMNIQLKTPTDSAMAEFVRLLKQYQRIDKTIVGIRNHRNLELKQKYPQLMIFMNDRKVHKLAVCYFLGLAPFLPISESSLQIPVYSSQFEQWNVGRTVQSDKWKIKLFMRMVKLLNFITRPLLWHLKRRGILSLGWVCNTNEAFQNAVDAGFQGIMTDDVFILDEYLEKKNLSIKKN